MASDAVLGTSRISISDLKKSLQALDISRSLLSLLLWLAYTHPPTEFYEILAHFGQYGPIYQRVTACWKTNGEALVEIRAYDKDLEECDLYLISEALALY